MRATIATMMVALATLVGATAAYAQSAETAKVIIVDRALIVRDSLAGKDLVRQGENFSAEIEAERARLEQDARNTEQELIRQRDIISEEALAEKMRIEQQRLAIAGRDLQEKVNRVQIAVRKAEADLQSALQPIFQEVMNSNNANIILDRNMLVQVGPGMDVTRIVIDKLNAALPSLKVDVPAASASAAP